MRTIVKMLSACVFVATLLLVVSPTLASAPGPTVKVLGGNSVKINKQLLSTFHFGPGRLHVSGHATVTFDNTEACTIDCDHTVSLVNESQLPSNITQIFACLIDTPGTVCATIGSAHFPQGPGGPVNFRVNVTGEPTGFQGANSFVLAHGHTLEISITAPAGTTLHYLCAIHPWMQGSITVGQNNADNNDD